MRRFLGIGVLTGVILGLTAGSALAVLTEFYHYARMEDYQSFQFEGLVLRDDGTWRLGQGWEEVLADDLPFFTEMADDGERLLLVGGGGPGKIILFEKKNSRHELIHSDEELLFSSVETLGAGRWAVGSGPGGKVYSVDAEGQLAVLVDTGASFVWDLLRQGSQLWIATGEGGVLFRYDLDKEELEEFATLPDENVFRLAVDEAGRLLAGTSGKGLLFRFDDQGRQLLLADFEAEEVQQILPQPGDTLFLGVARNKTDCEENCAAVYRLSGDGLLEKMLSSDSVFLGDLLPAREGGILVAAGDPGELDRLTDLYHGEVLLAEEGVFYNDILDDGEDLWLLQSKPCRLLRRSGPAREGSFRSEILDLTSNSRPGVIRVEGDLPKGTSLRVEVRGGQGEEPDLGWTDWSTCKLDDGSYVMTLAPTRYFQFRITLKGKGDKSPTLRRITASFLPLNRSPLIGNLGLLWPEGGLFAEGLELSGRPFTQQLERGVRAQYQLKSGPALADPGESSLLTGLRQLYWDWLDPDGDRLRARIEYKREGENQWQLLEQGWEESIYTWDTRGLPDGHYRLRVTASDHLDNLPDRARSMHSISEPTRLDSSPPRFDLRLSRDPKEKRLRVRGTVVDEGGGIVMQVQRRDWNNGDWVPEAGDAAFLDRPALELNLDLPLSPHATVLELRASDELGNWSFFRQELGE